MRLSRLASRATALASLAGLGLGSVVLPATAVAAPAPPSAAPAAPSAVAAAPTATAPRSWFRDPLTAPQRRAAVAVPEHPRRHHGKVRWTTAHYRTHSGRIAVPASWAVGETMVAPQALTFDRAGLFKVMSATPSRHTRVQLRRLASSFALVRAVRCEGYADHAGRPGREHPISLARARAICALIKSRHPSIIARAVGYGGTHPAVIGGRASQRSANRRVVVAVTASRRAATAPSAPVLRKVIAGDGSVTVRFGRPARTGGMPVTRYQASTDGGATWRRVTVSGRSPYQVQLRKLANGEQVEVAVRAGNSVGWSARSRVLKATPVAPATAPSAPQVLDVTPSAYGVVVKFAASVENAEQITGYEVSPDGGKTWRTVAKSDLVGAGPYTVTLANLPAGKPVQIVVRATWAGGSTGGGTEPVVETPYGVPGAVAIKAKGSDETISVVFAPPKDDGGTAVTGYQIDYGQAWTNVTPEPYDNGGLIVIKHGLTNGNTYAVRVRALNKAGAGAASPTVQVTPHTVPGAPTITNSQGFDGAVAVSFTAPADDGGAPVTGYQASYGGDWFDVDSTPEDGAWKVKRSGFTNGNSYPVRVRALNKAGHGAASDTVHVIPVAVPDAPVLADAVAGDGTAELTIEAPEHDGGTPVTGYQVSTNSGETWSAIDVSGNSPYTVELEDLENGVELSVVVRAGNEVGWSVASNARSVTPLSGAPSAPLMVSGVGGAYQVAVTFDAPATNADRVTGYEYSTDGGENWVAVAEGDLTGDGPYTLTLSDLKAGVGVDVWARATWSGGVGAASDAVSATPYGVPGAPSIVADKGRHGVITVSFEATEKNGGSPVTGYQISYGEGWSDVTSDPDNGRWTVSQDGFVNGVTYPVRVRAVNLAGHGLAGSTVEVTPITSPAAPTMGSITEGDQTLEVRFQPPQDDPGAPVTGYEATTTGGDSWFELTPSGSGSSELRVLLDGLVNGKAYDVAVRATNPAGHSPSSDMLNRRPFTVPGAPGLTSATADKRKVTLTFTAPESNGGSVVTKYQYQQDDGEWKDLTHSGDEPYTGTVDELANGTYSFRVRAVNAAGPGETSDVTSVQVEVLASEPTGPELHHAWMYSTNAMQFYVTVPSDNGATITGFEWTSDNGATWKPVTQYTPVDPGMSTYVWTDNGGPWSCDYSSYQCNELVSVRVRAVNSEGAGEASNSVQAWWDWWW